MKTIENSSSLIAACVETVTAQFDLLSKKLGQPIPLGPDFITLNHNDVDDHLRYYRYAKKWIEPSKADPERAANTVRSVFMTDSAGPSKNSSPFFSCEYNRRVAYCAKIELGRLLKRHYRFRPERFRMPSGETYLGAKGDISLLAKMRDREQWCVTPDCFEKACQVVYANRGLRKAAKAHFAKLSRKEHAELYTSCKYCDNKVGYSIFRERFFDMVTFVEGMRFSTVPKNKDIDRGIAMEPLLNMLVQSVVEEGIRDAIRAHFGVDLEISQNLHKQMIAIPGNATIDLKNASNSVYLSTCEYFLSGTDLYDDLLSSRSPIALYKDESHELRMMSPMGNGFTFGLMTLLLFAITRQLDSGAMVYGDDIIVADEVSHDLISILSDIHFETNSTKTFFEGSFRESCGAFWSYDHYVTCFDFEYPETLIDCITIANKLFIIAESTRDQFWVDFHAAYVKLFPPLCYGPVQKCEDLESRFIWATPGMMRRKRKDTQNAKVWASETAAQKDVLRKFQYEPAHVQAIVYHSYVDKVYRRIPTRNVKSIAWQVYYMYQGRCSAPTIRERVSKREIREHVHLVPYWSSPFVNREPGDRWCLDALKHFYMC